MKLAQKLENLRFFLTPAKKLPNELFPSQIVGLKSGKIRILVTGKGNQTVLLCPDPPNGLEHYTELIKLISEKYRVIAFEPPGFGYSMPSLFFDYSIFSGSILIKEILDYTSTETAILCLPCVSGLHSLQFAMDNPERVDGFVAIQTPDWDELLEWTFRTDRSNIIKTPFIGQFALILGSSKIQNIWYNVAEPDSERRKNYMKIKDVRHKNGCIFCLASAIQALKGKDPFQNRKLDKPSVIIWGGSDKSYGFRSGKKILPDTISKYLIDPKVIILPDAGHFPEMSFPEKLNEAIDNIYALKME